MRVDSPYVVQCHGVVRGGDDRICLVMEYMASGSLRDLLLARRSLPEEVIAVVARRVLEGLRYQHGLGIVHRDIKPANLLVSERGEVQIADFGASRMARAPEGDEPCMGTCAYMSPERFDSEGFGGGGVGGEFAGDVWALGVALLEGYTGREPPRMGVVDVHGVLRQPAGGVGGRVARVPELCPQVPGEGTEEERNGGGDAKPPFCRQLQHNRGGFSRCKSSC